MTAFAALTRLCPPPEETSRRRPIDWNQVESVLGVPLPEDYKRLASTYGPGSFADYLRVYQPDGVTEWVDLTGPMPARIRAQLQLDHDRGTYPVPYDPRQLLPMGGTDNGEHLFWITEPRTAPDAWRVAVNEARGPRWFTYDGTLTEFLVSVLSGETSVPQFPKDVLEPTTAFVPSDPTLWAPPQAPARPPVDSETIREWARANGHQVSAGGRIPAAIREAWENAHS
ncbi:histone-like nucleoid-structuring protein Lsr2 [Streptomyces sp. NPDC058411]|uniref:Lsr2 family DNA-binding protein n=1 Tax=Streptomyces sp. NPDC058411 TaxID=3346485 RepID=UPI003647603A